MPLKIQSIKAILVDNANYYANTQNDYANLRIILQVIDEATGSPVVIDELNQITISNDPFLKSENVVAYENVPNTSTTGINKITVTPIHFGATTAGNTLTIIPLPPDMHSSVDSAEFVFESWPLSVEAAGTQTYPGYMGGIKKVYFTLNIQGNGESLQYPEVGVAEATTPWIVERPILPGTPVPKTMVDEKTGPKMSWEFKTSNEESTAANNKGISRYIADLIEIREIHATADKSHLTLGGVENAAVVAISHVGDTYGTLTDPIILNDDKPDFCAQTYYVQTVGQTAFDVNLVLICDGVQVSYNLSATTINDTLTRLLVSDGEPGSAGTNINVPTSVFYNTSGGLFEIYYQDKADYAILAIYYTDLSTDQCYLLETIAVDNIKVPMTAMEFKVSTQAHGVCSEIALSSGRFIINADMGDCNEDEKSVASFPIVAIKNWTNAIGSIAQLESTSFVPTGSTINCITHTSYNQMFATPTNDTAGNRPINELQSLKPSFSNKVYTAWGMTHISGDFYIALSPIKATLGNPMIKRCDPDAVNTTIFEYMPTLAFVVTITTDIYDRLERKFSIFHYTENNTLIEQVLGTYPFDPESIDWYELSVETDIEYGTSIKLSINDTEYGKFALTQPFSINDNGLGLYLAMGVKTLRYHPGIVVDRVAGETYLYQPFYYKGLPPSKLSYAQKRFNTRHYSKSTNGSLELKPLLGQLLLAGNVNGEEYAYTNTGDVYKIYAMKISPSDDFDLIFAHDFLINTANRSLIEFKMKTTDTEITPMMPRIKIYSDTNNKPDIALSDWISCITSNNNYSRTSTGDIIPYNNLVQFDISSYSDAIKEETAFWVYIAVPPKCSIGTAWTK